MRCLRRTCNIRWQDRVSNTDILEKCELTSIEALLVQSQLRWAGHVIRMSDDRISKALLYGQLKDCGRRAGRPRLRYKHNLKRNLKVCKVDMKTWEADAANRPEFGEFEKNRIAATKEREPQVNPVYHPPPPPNRRLRAASATRCVSPPAASSQTKEDSRAETLIHRNRRETPSQDL